MNGTGFGSTRPEIFQQQHRLRSMSWCEGGEALSTTINKHKCEDTVMKQDETTTSSLGLIRSDSSESPSTEIINLKKPSARKNAWGCLSYADLIAKAIESSPNQRLTLNQIYSWMVENVPYFRAKGQTNSSAGWKNSIRHNLSLHGRFVRVQNEGAGKSSWWMVNNNNRMQKTPRRRSTTMDSKTFEKKKKINTFSKDCFSLESSSLSASVPAYIGSCSQYQPQQTYPQFLHHQQTHIRPLDSFESAFRPIDRQECIKFSKKDHSFSLKNTTALGYDDNCYNTCDVKNENPHEVRVENSCSSNGPNNNQILFCSLQNVIPSIIRQPVTCQNFGESEFNVTAGLPPQIPDRGLPDFFKLPDEAWRQYLPPSPNGLTEAVISSESLTALLESGADSEIVDLVPPSLSSFDESSHDHKKTLVGKELCMLTSASNDLSDLTSNLPGDNQQETSYGHKQLNSLLDSSLISTPINQERELMNYSTSLINQALNTDNYESNKSEKCFDQNCTPINLFSIKTSPKFISTLALQSSHLPMDSYSIQGKNHVLHDCQSLCSKEKELEDEFESKNSSFTLPYNMPSILETSTPLATTAITSTVPSHENTESVSSTLKS